MCGIAGLISPRADIADLAGTMADRIRHRGPDDRGVWTDQAAGVALGHRRLSILDLSPCGHQPMVSSDGRWVLAYNGEVYNHLALRAELGASRTWRGHSDTETLVEAIARWGLAATLERAVGMWALALWDRQTRTLHLARDRFGEKPLYYGRVAGAWGWASELKALQALPGFDNPVDRDALAALASYGFIPAPLSIHEGVAKLAPGTILSMIVADGRVRDEDIRIVPYWSYRDVVAGGLAEPFTNEDDALDALQVTLAQAVAGQAVADVPVGAFLSGGIDSSTVVALYSAGASGPINTYTIGFEDRAFDEAPFARAVASHFGTRHHEQVVSAADALAVIPALPAMYDEPFGDSSAVPTHLVSRFARRDVTVALSGDGGDELFGGYNRHVAAARVWGRAARIPGPLRRAGASALGAVPPATWNAVSAFMPGGRRQPHFGTKVQAVARTLGRAGGLATFHGSLVDPWFGQASPVLSAGPPAWSPSFARLDGAGHATRAMLADALGYLPDDILCKVDRAAMAVSLETRVPFLDHRVAAVAARIPERFKIDGGEGKKVLRRLLFRHAPPALFDRPKTGFGLPLGSWLRGPLRPWAEALLDGRRLAGEGYLDPAVVRARWERHLSGRTDDAGALWPLLMFQAWLDARRDQPVATPSRASAAA